MATQKHFIALADFTPDQLTGLIERTVAEKPDYLAGTGPALLPRKTLALIFEKPSLRTRVSFECGMTQLGGASIYLAPADIQLGKREPTKDVARVLGRMCDGIMARLFSHEAMLDLAAYSPVPVINGLTDYNHPCQALADLVTVREHFGSLKDKTLVFVGDGNNVARSLAVGCAKLGLRFILACPEGYALEEGFLATVQADNPQADLSVTHDPAAAIREADVVYTDTWVSMGQEEQASTRRDDFAPYQINDALMGVAPSRAIVLHCLPAYRDYEITDSVFEKHATTILAEAENRLHAQRTVLAALLAEGGIE
jgi:ornithine carbamoyltransferase